MKNVVKEALQSKLEDLKNQLVGIDNCYQSVENEYIGEWKFRHITMNNYLSDKAKAVIITKNGDSFNLPAAKGSNYPSIIGGKSYFKL